MWHQLKNRKEFNYNLVRKICLNGKNESIYYRFSIEFDNRKRIQLQSRKTNAFKNRKEFNYNLKRKMLSKSEKNLAVIW